ncbi:MAG: class I SAM-dependent methyltransferase [Lachnospiraceae bacterium]|nr:class I SAM-dependent methyltransferase [Lachnospiraceae bacterium]
MSKDLCEDARDAGPVREKPYLKRGPHGLILTDGKLELRADFTELIPRIRTDNLRRELLIKAVQAYKKREGAGEISVVDAAAGLGEDGFILAAGGCRVTLFEYDPVIAALLEDALDRAALSPELSCIVGRMTLRKEDSITGMQHLPARPDVVFLDPMFPERRKSGLVKKKFQLLQQLESPCPDEEGLFKAAVAAGPGRIVIKRPLKGPPLAGAEPSYSLTGKTVRYDCVVLRLKNSC